MNWIVRHFRRHLERRPWDFCWRIGLESTLVSLAAAVLLSIFINEPHKEHMEDWPVAALIVFLVLLGPPLETLLFQAFPIFIVRLLRGSMWTQVLVSATIFAAGHFMRDIVTGAAAGMVGGSYLAFAYVRWRRISKRHAFWITTGIHCINNGIAVLLIVIARNWGPGNS